MCCERSLLSGVRVIEALREEACTCLGVPSLIIRLMHLCVCCWQCNICTRSPCFAATSRSSLQHSYLIYCLILYNDLYSSPTHTHTIRRDIAHRDLVADTERYEAKLGQYVQTAATKMSEDSRGLAARDEGRAIMDGGGRST